MRYIKIEDLLVFRSRWGQGDTLWKNSVLKKDFRDFFHNKCWYTEVPLVGQDVHIDHFRPKAAVKPFENFFVNQRDIFQHVPIIFRKPVKPDSMGVPGFSPFGDVHMSFRIPPRLDARE